MSMYWDAIRLFTFIQLGTSCSGYYWRNYYHEEAPQDAFVAGTDINNKNIYIGQVYVSTDKHQAILPATVREGKDIHVPFYGDQKSDSFVQILCSENKDFYEWIPANSTHIHLLPTNNKFVWGGVEDNKLVAIGRIWYQGSRVIGKVLSGIIENAPMYFVYNGKELVTNTYEVLTYNDTGPVSIALA